METLKDVGRFCLGLVFLVSLIPPALIIGGMLLFAPIERTEGP